MLIDFDNIPYPRSGGPAPGGDGSGPSTGGGGGPGGPTTGGGQGPQPEPPSKDPGGLDIPEAPPLSGGGGSGGTGGGVGCYGPPTFLLDFWGRLRLNPCGGVIVGGRPMGW
jgi:hypothetical protein